MSRNWPAFASLFAALALTSTPLHAAPARPADNAGYAALVPQLCW